MFFTNVNHEALLDAQEDWEPIVAGKIDSDWVDWVVVERERDILPYNRVSNSTTPDYAVTAFTIGTMMVYTGVIYAYTPVGFMGGTARVLARFVYHVLLVNAGVPVGPVVSLTGRVIM